ncbi:MAG: pit accessory protein [Verrucomicrobia bacterium 12-59-8]|nr:MAG: pit accessory protein [Verrucomicrobia bacterium 12-59-8]
MISFQKIFGKSDVFYGLLESSASHARQSVQSLHKLLSDPTAPQNLDAFIAARREDKKITQQIDEALCKTFVTELEREDIESLANALYKIPKTVEKIAERLLICSDRLAGVDFSRQVKFMDAAAEVVLTMVVELRKKMHLERVKDLNDQIQLVEGEADKLMIECLRVLYSTEKDAVLVVILKDLYDLMEKVVDRCRDAGNVVAHIVLKNS